MAPLVDQASPHGLPKLSLQLQAAAQLQLQRAEAWMHQMGARIASSHPALRQLLQQVDDFKLSRVQSNNRRSSPSSLSATTTNLRNRQFAAIIPGDSVAELVITSSVFNFLNIYNTILIARLVLTWFPSAPEVIVNPLSTICDPYLNVFRGIIPPLGTLDLSPILAFTVLNVFTSTAQALPAELDSKPREHNKLGWRQLAQRKKGLKPSN